MIAPQVNGRGAMAILINPWPRLTSAARANNPLEFTDTSGEQQPKTVQFILPDDTPLESQNEHFPNIFRKYVSVSR